MNAITVVLAEDHQIVRQGLRLLIDSKADIKVVGEAANGVEAFEMIIQLAPDVAVFDISMPLMNGIELIEKLSTCDCKTKMLALTANEDRAYMQHLIRFGVQGYLLKRSAADELIMAIRTIARGERYLDPLIVNVLIDGVFASEPGTNSFQASRLSDREEEVVKLLAHGFTNKEVASKLDISVKTVETHKSRAMNKAGLRSRAEIVRFAMSRGWLPVT